MTSFLGEYMVDMQPISAKTLQTDLLPQDGSATSDINMHVGKELLMTHIIVIAQSAQRLICETFQCSKSRQDGSNKRDIGEVVPSDEAQGPVPVDFP